MVDKGTKSSDKRRMRGREYAVRAGLTSRRGGETLGRRKENTYSQEGDGKERRDKDEGASNIGFNDAACLGLYVSIRQAPPEPIEQTGAQCNVRTRSFRSLMLR